MPLIGAYVPLGGYWSTPFCRWQGSFADYHPLELAADVAARALQARGLGAGAFDGLHLGTTVPSPHAFYGVPWLAGMMGLPDLTGPTISQGCATSVRLLRSAALEIETGQAAALLAVAADRTSNGPHMVYGQPKSPGGTPLGENWVWDNFHCDPNTGSSMLQTAENVAVAHDFTRDAQHEMVLLRHAQYQAALAGDASFQSRFMVAVGGANGQAITGDEGVYASTAASLAKLQPVVAGGSVTFGAQTHPADGNAAVIVASRARALEWASEPGVVSLLGFGEARAPKGWMPQAAVPAARRALAAADLGVDDVAAFKIHDPFAVNDLYFCQEMGLPPERINQYGCSLIYGHPQAPTGLRGIIELIEELRLRGGGIGLFAGCSAGDSAAAAVIKLDDGAPRNYRRMSGEFSGV